MYAKSNLTQKLRSRHATNSFKPRFIVNTYRIEWMFYKTEMFVGFLTKLQLLVGMLVVGKHIRRQKKNIVKKERVESSDPGPKDKLVIFWSD